MRKVFLFLSIFMMVVVSVSAQNQGNKRLMTAAEAAPYIEKIQPQGKTSSFSVLPSTPIAPAMVLDIVGNSYSGITANAYNAKELPEGTVVMGVKYRDGNFQYLASYYMGGTFPAGLLTYQFDNGLRGVPSEFPQLVTYQIFVFFPNGEISTTTGYKDVNKYWSGQLGAQKLIDDVSVSIGNNSTVLTLTGPITSTRALSAVLRDPETDYYNQTAVPPSAIRYSRRGITIDLSATSFNFGANGEVTVIVATDLGLTDQYTFRVKLEQVVIPQ